MVDGKLVERGFVAPWRSDLSANGLCWPLDHQDLEEWRLHLVMDYFAIHPGTCLLRESRETDEFHEAGGRAWFDRYAPPVLALFEDKKESQPAYFELSDIPLVVAVHEYCHANQFWHMQRSSLDTMHPGGDDLERFLTPTEPWKYHRRAAWWAYATPAGRAFIEAVGMSWNRDIRRWDVPSFPFSVMYRSNPLELAAEVCTEYFSKILEIDSRYAWVTWRNDYTVILPGLDAPGIADPSGSKSGIFDDRRERVDWDSDAVLTDEVMQWLNDWVLLPHVLPGSEPPPTDLGDCVEDMRVGLGQNCSVPDAPNTFEVLNGSGGAWSPCDQRTADNLNDATIKVDIWKPWKPGDPGACGRLPVGWTFQAERAGDAWFVRAVGQWRNVGECVSDLVVSPGEYCTVRRLGWTSPDNPTPVQFRVYAVDELVPSDTRSLYSKGGYAVLYYWPNRERPDPNNGRLHHGLVDYSRGRFHFRAVKTRLRGEWRITTVG